MDIGKRTAYAEAKPACHVLKQKTKPLHCCTALSAALVFRPMYKPSACPSKALGKLLKLGFAAAVSLYSGCRCCCQERKQHHVVIAAALPAQFGVSLAALWPPLPTCPPSSATWVASLSLTNETLHSGPAFTLPKWAGTNLWKANFVSRNASTFL